MPAVLSFLVSVPFAISVVATFRGAGRPVPPHGVTGSNAMYTQGHRDRPSQALL